MSMVGGPASRLRRPLRRTARAAAATCFAAAKRLPPGSRPARLLNRIAASVEVRSRALKRPRRAQAAQGAAAYESLADARLRFRVEVRLPLVLVTQAHRSGGTLLTRLFDGHPQLLTLPHELGPLLPERPLPRLPDDAWPLLEDPKLAGFFAEGIPQAGADLHGDRARVPMLLPPALHRLLFDRELAEAAPSERAVLDAYLTAYFNAWLDYSDLRTPKSFVVGFEPGLFGRPDRLRHFDELYPDGRVVSIVRDPWSWYASARRWDRRWSLLQAALDHWAESVEAALRLRYSRPDRVRLVAFEGLVGESEATMRELASWLGIDFDPVLLRPTINRLPVGANSSFATRDTEISPEPARRRSLLSPDEDAAVDERVGALYAQAVEQLDIGRAAAAAGRPSSTG